ncbi:MAG: GTP cyclohydrolase II [Cyanobacteria bacterium J06650_10]
MANSHKDIGSSVVQRFTEFSRPTAFGDFRVISYNVNGSFVFALTRGNFPSKDALVRIQSACLFGESFGVNSCDCGEQLTRSLKIGSESAPFILIYLTYQEGRGLGSFQKLRAIEVEANQGVDMVESFNILGFPLDLRDYRTASAIIRDINSDFPIKLMTNNPKKVDALKEDGIEISERVELLVEPQNDECRSYLSSKKNKMNHILPHVD